MKLGVVGKGGVGKTTLSALIAQAYATTGRRVVAIDTDSNPNLGMSLGLILAETPRAGTAGSAPGDRSSTGGWCAGVARSGRLRRSPANRWAPWSTRARTCETASSSKR